MARQAGWGKDIPDMLRNENWNYAVFTTDKKHRAVVNQAECLACHKPLDKESYTFTLKRGMRFSNGKVVRPADVVATFDRLATPAINSPAIPFFTDIAGAPADMLDVIRSIMVDSKASGEGKR